MTEEVPHCVLAGGPCPQSGPTPGRAGCPHWVDGLPLERTEEGALPKTEWFKGCQLSVLIPLLRGVAVTNTEVAASVQSVRNGVAEGFHKLVAVVGMRAVSELPRRPSNGERRELRDRG